MTYHSVKAGEAYQAYVTALPNFPTRSAPLWSPNDSGEERVAKVDDVYDLILPGDAGWYSGAKPHSWLIRAGSISHVSHGFLFDRDNTGVYVVESLEGVGIRRVELRDYIRECNLAWNFWRGTPYWAPVDRFRFYDFDGEAAMAFTRRYIPGPNGELPEIGTGKYGRLAVAYESLFHLPIIRIFAYWRWYGRLPQALKDCQPYCSMYQIMAAIAGGYDPVPGKIPQMSVPQDTHQSLLWASEKVALVL
jgi:hypothetical protein